MDEFIMKYDNKIYKNKEIFKVEPQKLKQIIKPYIIIGKNL